MSKQTFFPFRVARTGITLGLLVNGQSPVFDEQQHILAYSLAGTSLSLQVKAKIDPALYDKVLPPDERANPPAEFRFTLRSIRGRRREAHRFSADGSLTLTLPKAEWVGAVEVQAYLIRSTTRPDLRPGYAADRGAVLALTDPMVVLFDEQTGPSKGGSLDIRWDDFATSKRDFLHQQPESLSAVDTTGFQPVLYINRGLERTVTILTAKGKTGPIARLRDTQTAAIGQTAWQILLTETLLALASALKEQPVEDAVINLNDWQQQVLRFWAPLLYPGSTREESLASLCAVMADGDWQDLRLYLVPKAVQRHVKAAIHFAAAAKAAIQGEEP